MSELRQIITTNKLDILCIQEPYWCHGTLGSFPPSMAQIYHKPSSWVATVISNPLLTITKISQCTDDFMCTAEIRHKGTKFYIINQYCKFGDAIDTHINKLIKFKDMFRNSGVIYMADVNAKATDWYADHTDEKGEIVLNAFHLLKLEIINKAGLCHTFINSQGHRSNIDVTAASRPLADKINNWTAKHDTTSDHGLITFNVNQRRPPSSTTEREKRIRSNTPTGTN